MIPTIKNIKTISDMRENAKKLLHEAQSSHPLFIFYRSKPQAVLMSLDEYQKLVELAEDAMDSRRAQEFEDQDKKAITWVSHEEVKKLVR